MTRTRVLTAAVLVPVVVGIVWFAPTWVVALSLFGVVSVALHEFFTIGKSAGMVSYPRWIVFCAGLILLSQWWLADTPRSIAFGPVLYPLAISQETVFLITIVGIGLLMLVDRRGVSASLPASALSSAGMLLVAFPLSYIIRLHGQGAEGPKFVLLALVLVWVGDTTAYFVGRGLGRNKLAPAISPNKTWEGAVGNLLGTVGAVFMFQAWFPLDILQAVGLGVLVSVVGQVGDLAESAWKRGAGVKDSGALLPGHGGVLDRIDALIFAAPAVWWYFRMIVLP